MSFHVGQKVVCIDVAVDGRYTPWKIRRGAHLSGLTKSSVYTIRALGSWRGETVVWLDEIVRDLDDIWPECGEPGFSPRRFRPVKTTSIKIFKAMLVNPPKEAIDA